jgi:hypothetical protein
VIIDIDLTGGPARIELVDPDDCLRFHVGVRGGDADMLGAVLPAHDLGRLLPSGDAMIQIAAVRRMAAGRVPDGWDDTFAAMLNNARSNGWLDDTGEAIQAHVAWAHQD